MGKFCGDRVNISSTTEVGANLGDMKEVPIQRGHSSSDFFSIDSFVINRYQETSFNKGGTTGFNFFGEI